MLFPIKTGDACRVCKLAADAELEDDMREDETADDASELQPCITLWRGSPPWAPHWEFIGFEDAGVLIVGINSWEGWRFGQHEGEVWVYFRTQDEWRCAWRMARIVAREWSFPARLFHGFASVLAYKPAYEEELN